MATPPESALVSPPRAPAGPPTLIAATDGELLRLFAKRVEQQQSDADEVFAQIMDRHQAMVWRVCRGVLHRRQDAEDAFQATFLILARRARSIQANDSAAGWLYRVAHRTAIAARRLSRKRRERELESEPLAPEIALPDLATREMAGVLMEELRRLPDKYQTPLVLRYLEGQSRRAIAEQTDATIATVQGQIARGKALLRRRLVQRGVSLSAAMAVVAGSGKQSESAPLTVLGPTGGNATAAASGGSLAASTAVITLFREGVRAMFVSQLAKPTAAVAMAIVVAMLMTAPSLSGDVAAPARASRQLPLNAEPPAEAPAEAPAVKIDAAKNETSDGPIYAWTYFLPTKVASDAPDAEVELQLERFAEQIKNSVHPNQWKDGEAGEWEVRPYIKKRSLVVSAPQRAQEAIAEAIKKIKDDLRPKSPVFVDKSTKSDSQEQASPFAEPGTRVVVFRRTKPGYFGASASGEFMIAGKVDDSEQLQLNIPGRADGKLGGFLDQTTKVPLDVRGKNAAEIQRELADRLKDHNILAMNHIVDGKWVGEKDLKPVNVTVSRVEFAGDKRGDQPYSKMYKSDKLPLEVVQLIVAVANSALNKRHVVMDWHDTGGLIVHANQENHDQIKRVIKRLEEKQPIAMAESSPRFRPGDSLRVQVAGAMPDAPIDDVYVIESMGTAPLGPVYGRVKVAGMTIPEAEKAVTQHLSKILKDPEVQITNTAQAETPTRPTPENGAVIESWPSGQTKSEREYEDGKLVAAVEYAEDGTPLYEFVDRGANKDTKPKKAAEKKLSADEQREKLFGEVELLVKQAETHLALATDVIESGDSLAEINDFVRFRADQARAYMQDADSRLNSVINNAVAIESRSESEDHSMKRFVERIRPLAKRISAADSQAAQYQTQGIVQRLVLQAQAKDGVKSPEKRNEDDKPPKPVARNFNDEIENIEKWILRAENEITRAERLTQQPIEEQSESVRKVFFNVMGQAAGSARSNTRRANSELEDLMRTVLRGGSEKTPGVAEDSWAIVQDKLVPLVERIDAVDRRINEVAKFPTLSTQQRNEKRLREQSLRKRTTRQPFPSVGAANTRQKFVPAEGVSGSSWNVYHEPTIYNPHGRATHARLTIGKTAPVPLTDDIKPRAQLKLASGNDASVVLTTATGPEEDGGGGPQEFRVRRNEPLPVTVHGQRFELLYTSPLVEPGGSRETPYAQLLIKQAPPAAAK